MRLILGPSERSKRSKESGTATVEVMNRSSNSSAQSSKMLQAAALTEY